MAAAWDDSVAYSARANPDWAVPRMVAARDGEVSRDFEVDRPCAFSDANIRGTRPAVSVLLFRRPAVSPNEGNEARGRDGATLQRLTSSNDEREHLSVSLAKGSQQPSTFG